MAISIVSPTGRALQAELEQSQGMPPDQLMAKLNQSVGMVPFAELLAMKMQYDRLKNAQPPQPPPQGTVAQDMAQEISARQQGVAGLNPQNVGTQHMAGGGIVAFAGRDSSFVGPNAGGPHTAPNIGLNNIPKDALTAEEWAKLNSPATSVAEKQNITSRGWARVKNAQSSAGKALRTPIPGGPSAVGKMALRGAAKTVPYALAGGAISGAYGLGQDRYDANALREAYKSMGYNPEDSAFSNFVLTDWAQDPNASKFKGVASDATVRGMGVLDRTLGGVTGGINALLPEFMEIPFTPVQDVVDERLARTQAAKEKAAAVKPEEDNWSPLSYFNSDPSSGGLSSIYQAAAGRIQPYDLKTGREEEIAPDRDAIMNRVRKEDAEQGIGKADEEELARLGKQREEEKSEKKRDTWLSAAEGFFKMAQAAGEPGATFLGAAAEGATAGLSSYKQVLKDYKQSEKELRAAEYAAKKAGEALRLNQTERGQNQYDKAMDRLDSVKTRNAQRESQLIAVNAQIMMNNLDNATKAAIAKLAEQDKQFIWNKMGEIATQAQREGKPVSEANRRVDKFLEWVGKSTDASYGGVRSAMIKAQQGLNPYDYLSGGGGETGGSVVGVRKISED